MMKNESNAELALNAMRRAARQAVQKAADLGLKIPVWKDGKIIYEDAREKLRRMNQVL